MPVRCPRPDAGELGVEFEASIIRGGIGRNAPQQNRCASLNNKLISVWA
ncbi:hypothetical protein XIS1_350002 [Xenorhabdus innexi]|uniref:Uncharacterized protein n=1 Tax=Xenorhabdus innexi TaxID=290109 RepID=A0A1N6MXK4_9GAMM|nr:hypothetical protein XIS1_350002 [Xenorhabdus innexi]